MRQIIFLTIVILATACAKGGGDSGSSAQSFKGVFSKWSDSGKTFDLTGGQFNSALPVYLALAGGTICTTTMIVTGDNSSGSWVMSGSVEYSAGAATDPSCSTLDGSGTYMDSGSAMTVCRTSPAAEANCTTWN